MTDYSGLWIGKFEGTNHGGVYLELRQFDQSLVGTAAMAEVEYGPYHYSVSGTVNKGLSLELKPGWQPGGLILGTIHVDGQLDEAAQELSGRWVSTLGTKGVFLVRRNVSGQSSSNLPAPNSVFIVHGRDEASKQAVARFLERLDIYPIVLQEQTNEGRTVIEKFERFAARAGFAVILMTPDDCGYLVGQAGETKFRPRQNVLLELGYFAALLGRGKTLVMVKGELELPSDILGLVYEKMDLGDGWQLRLARELKAAGFNIDLNRLSG